MSRSYHKMCSTKGIFCNWVCYKSNKKDKRFANRKIRRQVNQNLKDYKEEKTLLQYPREVSDVWNFSSDGLKRFLRVRRIDKDKYAICSWWHRHGETYTKAELKKQFFCK